MPLKAPGRTAAPFVIVCPFCALAYGATTATADCPICDPALSTNPTPHAVGRRMMLAISEPCGSLPKGFES